MTENNPFAFFYRIDGLRLIDGNKSAGFELCVDRFALMTLAKIEFEPVHQMAVLDEIKKRVTRAKLLPASLTEEIGVVFWEKTLVPRYFQGDPMLGGSLGADPEIFSRLNRSDAHTLMLDEVRFTPHNVDTAKMALALVIMVQTWGEYATRALHDAWLRMDDSSTTGFMNNTPVQQGASRHH